jgi:hypothetical protein
VSAEQLDSFRELVLADVALQARLRWVTDTGAFVVEVERLAARHGFVVEAADVESAMRQARQSWLERWI